MSEQELNAANHTMPEDLRHSEFTPDTADASSSEATEDRSSGFRRRGFIRGTAALLGASAAAGIITPDGGQEVNAQTTAGASLIQQLRLVRRHENAHVVFLKTALGASARPKPTFKNLRQPSLSAFLTVSRKLENTGVGAYLGALPVLFSRGYVSAAGSIALVEARHAGYFNTVQSRPMTENVFGQELDFERALTIQEVVSQANPFISSLNGGPPLTFSSTPSNSNDIAILNFALALEFLEAEFYNVNVPIYAG